MPRLPKYLLVLMMALLLAGCAFGRNTPAAEEATQVPVETPVAEATEMPAETPMSEEEAAEEAAETPMAEEEAAAETSETPAETPTAEEEAVQLPAETPAAEEEGVVTQLPEVVPSPFDAEILKNLAYTLELVGDEAVQLTDGVYDDAENQIHASWVDTYALGDINGQPTAAVVLVANTGGSGTFSYLALVMDQEGEAVNVTSTLLGDRITLNWVSIANDEVHIDFVTQGDDDPMCCATQRTLAIYVLDSNELVNTNFIVIGVQPQLGETQIVTYTPDTTPEITAVGVCTENALGLGRADAWRCTTEDSLVYDPCFEASDTGAIVCGTDPIMGEEGFVLELSEPLPEPDPGPIPGAWLVQLGDGTICGLLTLGTIPSSDNWMAPYGCADDAHSNLMNQIFTAGPVLYAQNVVLDPTDDDFTIQSSVRTPVATIWR